MGFGLERMDMQVLVPVVLVKNLFYGGLASALKVLSNINGYAVPVMLESINLVFPPGIVLFVLQEKTQISMVGLHAQTVLRESTQVKAGPRVKLVTPESTHMKHGLHAQTVLRESTLVRLDLWSAPTAPPASTHMKHGFHAQTVLQDNTQVKAGPRVKLVTPESTHMKHGLHAQTVLRESTLVRLDLRSAPTAPPASTRRRELRTAPTAPPASTL
jgi:1,6-anhydro-N-acetylmuramate kinase